MGLDVQVFTDQSLKRAKNYEACTIRKCAAHEMQV
jgi:hypothetical protein